MTRTKLLPAIVLLSTLCISAVADYSGLSGEYCRSNSDCNGKRRCVSFANGTFSLDACKHSTATCRCSARTKCKSSARCDVGEACYRFHGGKSFCLSCRFISVLVEAGFKMGVDGYATCGRLGLEIDQCREDSMCKPPRACEDVQSSKPCTGRTKRCVCFGASTPCSGCKDCRDAGESCFTSSPGNNFCASNARFLLSRNAPLYGRKSCGRGRTSPPPVKPHSTPRRTRPPPVKLPSTETAVSLTSASPEPEPVTMTPTPVAESEPFPSTETEEEEQEGEEEEGTSERSRRSSSARSRSESAAEPYTVSACVGAHHLAGLASTDLVFGRHRTVAVLCDRQKSCATAGHIVVFRGAPMHMARYCALDDVSCTVERIEVNSPRMRRGVRVGSSTPGLEFTALSARFGTRVEEAVMRALVMFGM